MKYTPETSAGTFNPPFNLFIREILDIFAKVLKERFLRRKLLTNAC